LKAEWLAGSGVMAGFWVLTRLFLHATRPGDGARLLGYGPERVGRDGRCSPTAGAPLVLSLFFFFAASSLGRQLVTSPPCGQSRRPSLGRGGSRDRESRKEGPAQGGTDGRMGKSEWCSGNARGMTNSPFAGGICTALPIDLLLPFLASVRRPKPEFNRHLNHHCCPAGVVH
jgi:hypothetical protein